MSIHDLYLHGLQRASCGRHIEGLIELAYEAYLKCSTDIPFWCFLSQASLHVTEREESLLLTWLDSDTGEKCAELEDLLENLGISYAERLSCNAHEQMLALGTAMNNLNCLLIGLPSDEQLKKCHMPNDVVEDLLDRTEVATHYLDMLLCALKGSWHRFRVESCMVTRFNRQYHVAEALAHWNADAKSLCLYEADATIGARWLELKSWIPVLEKHLALG